jgi:polar amino acid transport system permease protein
MVYQFRWDTIVTNFPFLLAGLWETLTISALTLILAMLGGLIIVSLDMSQSRPVRAISITFGEIVRNTPILVQLLWIYYVLPIVFDVQVSSFAAAIVALSVYSSAFIGEVYRAGIQGVPKGHREAAAVLGMSKLHTFGRIVLPQAFRASLPPLASNFVQLIKYSSLASVLSVSEITRKGVELASSTFRPLEIFTFIAVVYFCICWPLSLTIRWLEARSRRRS